MTFSIVILAAGAGKRMHSQLPKVLHHLAGKPLLEHVIHTAQQLESGSSPIIIYGHQGDIIRQTLSHLSVNWIEQKEQLGTGHALLQALPYIASSHPYILVLYGDVPLISVDTLKNFIASVPHNTLGIITATVTDPSGLGRIIRNQHNQITAIIEEKDATKTQRNIKEINTGIYLIPETMLKKWLPTIQNHNAQGEHYLTDIVKMAVEDQIPIHTVSASQEEEILGVNNRRQLAILERYYQRQIAERLMHQGVTLLDPTRFDVRGELTVGQDTIIDINVIIEGQVTIGNNCHIGPHTVLRNTTLEDNIEIKAYSHIDGATISSNCIIGPYARIRPESKLSPHVHIGNFVEIKKSTIQEYSKVNHLTYIGDCEIGRKVNIGAGTITCNYDGVNKHRTIIGDNAFIGSNTQLVAPVKIGEGATIGAGSTITRDAPAHQLTLCRAQQRSIKDWKKPEKIKGEQ